MLLNTNITQEINKIIKDCFPKDNPLSKIINKNTIQISYSTTANFESKIKQHNNKILMEGKQKTKECKCTKFDCPLEGKCGQENVIYQAVVEPGPQDNLTIDELNSIKNSTMV